MVTQDNSLCGNCNFSETIFHQEFELNFEIERSCLWFLTDPDEHTGGVIRVVTIQETVLAKYFVACFAQQEPIKLSTRNEVVLVAG